MNDIEWNKKCNIIPSLITLDMCNLENQCKLVEESGLSTIHVDILDGYFSPSMPLGIDTVKQLRKKTNLLFDAHVMANNPRFFVEELIEAGASQISFHIETCDHIDEMINYIHNKGVKVGVALKPATTLDSLEYIIEKCDVVTLMLINPGFAQQKGEQQISYTRKKIHDLHSLIKSRNLNTKVLLDGRVSKQNIETFGITGEANFFVAGSTCIDKGNVFESLKELKMLEDIINKN